MAGDKGTQRLLVLAGASERAQEFLRRDAGDIAHKPAFGIIMQVQRQPARAGNDDIGAFLLEVYILAHGRKLPLDDVVIAAVVLKLAFDKECGRVLIVLFQAVNIVGKQLVGNGDMLDRIRIRALICAGFILEHSPDADGIRAFPVIPVVNAQIVGKRPVHPGQIIFIHDNGEHLRFVRGKIEPDRDIRWSHVLKRAQSRIGIDLNLVMVHAGCIEQA